MERKRYLELCMRNSVYREGIFVERDGVRYIPQALTIYFDKDGKAQNMAVLKDIKANSILDCDLNNVNEIEEDLK